MKRIRFKREKIDSTPFVADIITEDPGGKGYYYFYDEKGIYNRIKKIHEGTKYTITSLFIGGQV